jgi:hypothetical protein
VPFLLSGANVAEERFDDIVAPIEDLVEFLATFGEGCPAFGGEEEKAVDWLLETGVPVRDESGFRSSSIVVKIKGTVSLTGTESSIL